MKVTQKLTKIWIEYYSGGRTHKTNQNLCRTYSKSFIQAQNKKIIKGMAHITGGGLIENIPRILPEGCAVTLERSKWNVPKIFEIIQEIGNIDDQEMFHVFNMGIGVANRI